MDLLEKIDTDFKTALKERDASRVGVLRMLKSALKNKAVEKQADLDDKDILQIIKSEVKKRKESIEAFQKAERQDLVAKEEAELEILDTYMPEQMGEERIKEIVAQVRQALPEENQNDFGRVMGAVMKEVGGQADGQTVGRLVKESIGK